MNSHLVSLKSYKDKEYFSASAPGAFIWRNTAIIIHSPLSQKSPGLIGSGVAIESSISRNEDLVVVWRTTFVAMQKLWLWQVTVAMD